MQTLQNGAQHHITVGLPANSAAGSMVPPPTNGAENCSDWGAGGTGAAVGVGASVAAGASVATGKSLDEVGSAGGASVAAGAAAESAVVEPVDPLEHAAATNPAVSASAPMWRTRRWAMRVMNVMLRGTPRIEGVN